MKQLIADYEVHKRPQWSPRTRDLNANVLEKAFLRWCDANQITEASQLNQRTLDRWTNYLTESHQTPQGGRLATESIRTYSRTLNSFILWAQGENEVAAKVKAQQPRREHRLYETLSREQIQSMEDKALSERDALVVRVLADSGIRLAELLALRAEDLKVDRRNYYLKVQGKGKRDRLVPIREKLFTRLRKFADRGNHERIFMTARRQPRTRRHEPLQPRSVQNMLAALAEEAGITITVSPHVFRHSYATWRLRNGISPFQLADILGHASLDMVTRVYGHLVPADLFNAMMALPDD